LLVEGLDPGGEEAFETELLAFVDGEGGAFAELSVFEEGWALMSGGGLVNLWVSWVLGVLTHCQGAFSWTGGCSG